MSYSLDTLRSDIAAILNLPADEVGDEDNLMDLGLDSLRAMTLALNWDKRGIKADFASLAEETTLSGWWRVISGAP